MHRKQFSLILSLLIVPFHEAAFPGRFYEGPIKHEFDCSFQFNSFKALDCGCIDGLWKFYKTDCEELMTVGGDKQFCFPMNHNVTRAEMILPNKRSLAVVKEGVIIPLHSSKLPIEGGENDEIFAGDEWTLSDGDGNSICLATHPNSYCAFRVNEFGFSQITHARRGCGANAFSVLPRNCYTMYSENKDICRHRVVKRGISKSIQDGGTFFGGSGQKLEIFNGSLNNNTYDEDLMNETLHVIPEDSFASEVFNFMDAKLNELLDLQEPTRDFNYVYEPTYTEGNPNPPSPPSPPRTRPPPLTIRPKTTPSSPSDSNPTTSGESEEEGEESDGKASGESDEEGEESDGKASGESDEEGEESDGKTSEETDKGSNSKTYIDLDEGEPIRKKPGSKSKANTDQNEGESTHKKSGSKGKTYIDLDEGKPGHNKPGSKGKTYIDLGRPATRQKRAARKPDPKSQLKSPEEEISKIFASNRAPVYQLLDLSRKVMQKTCPDFYVHPEFIDIAVLAFIRVNQRYYKFPEDDSYYYGYGRIIKSLQECASNLTAFNFTVDPCKTRDTLASGRYCAFDRCDLEINILAGFENFEPMVETVWNVFVNAHSACFDFFKDGYNDHHKFLTWMTPIFQTQINDIWKNGTSKGIVYGGLFGNVENVMAAVTYCTVSQQMLSNYPFDLPRPNKAEDMEALTNFRRKRDANYYGKDDLLSGECSMPQTTASCGI